MNEKRLSIDPYDYLRVLAALMVFFLHTYLFVDNYTFPTEGWEILLGTPAWAGVWIFVVLGGFFAEKGFYDKRYMYTRKGIVRYYLTRTIKILVPTYLFVLMTLIIYDQHYIIENPSLVIDILVRMFTLTYTGTPSIDGLGATWYVFTIMWLYLLAPIFSLTLRKLSKRSKYNMHILLIITVLSGLSFRLFMVLQVTEYSWYLHVYVNPLANIDLFLSGMIAYRISKMKSNGLYRIKKAKIISVLSISIVFATNCWFYAQERLFCLHVYQYIYPTLWLLVTIGFLVIFFEDSYRRESPTFSQYAKRPVLFVGFLSSISFEFYLWHSVLDGFIGPVINHTFGPWGPLQCLLAMFLFGFLVTILFAYMFHVFTGKLTTPILKIVNTKLKESMEKQG